jgi:uncharacterized protein YndB with AHSA1/START domain
MRLQGLEVTTPGDREIAMRREFAAPPRLVFEANTRPELLSRWLGVFGGWKMVECEVDLRVGGAYRYVWNGPNGERMAMAGVFREIEAPTRLVATEKFADPWYEGEAETTTELVARGDRTLLTMTTRYASKPIRDEVMKSPMAEGVGKSFDTLEALLDEPHA